MFALPTKPDRRFRHFGVCQQRSGHRLRRRFHGSHSCAPAFRTGRWSLFHDKPSSFATGLAYRRLEAAVSAFGMPAWTSGSRMRCPSMLAFIAAKRTMRESLARTSLVPTIFRIVDGRSWCGHKTVPVVVNKMKSFRLSGSLHRIVLNVTMSVDETPTEMAAMQ